MYRSNNKVFNQIQFSKTVIIAVSFALPLMIGACSSNNNGPENVKSPEAVAEVLRGERPTANAAWWGFDEKDATNALQGAIDSGAETVIVPDMGAEWFVLPINLDGGQELILEEGVIISAKPGEYHSTGASLFSGVDISNLKISGYGAILKMQKHDYQDSTRYEQAEWRHGIRLMSCTNITIEGLTIRDTGGDGVYLGDSGGEQNYNKNIILRDIICDNNHRQGISIISANGLLVENCSFINTWGTPPAAGADFEPNHTSQHLVDCVMRNCRFENNEGAGICLEMAHQDTTSEPISIRFEDCYVTSAEPESLSIQLWDWHLRRRGCGFSMGRFKDSGPLGTVEFVNCTVEDTWGVGLYVYTKSSASAMITFDSCSWVRTAQDTSETEYLRVPMWFNQRHPDLASEYGGFTFQGCRVEDNHNRPIIVMTAENDELSMHDVYGTLTVQTQSESIVEPQGLFQTADITLNRE
jgi:parallel beta-helix repeat protein